ncbi:unnamed protein product [Parajaminaea phylloscopi]
MSQSQADTTEAASEGQVPRVVGPDGLTNKERRKAKQAEKRKRNEDGPAEQTSVATEAAGQSAVESTAEQTQNTGEEEADAEVEALSHKERRKRRKMEKQGIVPPAAAAAQTDQRPGGPPREGLPDRSRYSVWVGNLAFSTTTQRLQAWLHEREIFGISRINMPIGARKHEYNKGFAYVDLPTEEAVTAAVALSEDHLDGRRLLIKSGSDFRGRPALDPALAALASQIPSAPSGADDVDGSARSSGQVDAGALGATGKTGLTKTAQKILRSQKNPAGPTLFIGNMSFNSTQEGLHELFEASAKARDAWRKPSKEEKRAEKRALKAKRQAEKNRLRKAKADDGDSSSSDSEDGASVSAESDSDSDADSEEEEDAEEEEGEDSEKPSGETSKAAQKPKTPKANVIRGAGIRKVRMGTFEDSGKCKGFAFVDFHTPAHAAASLVDPRNYRLDGRELKVEFASAEAVRRGAPKSFGTGNGAPHSGGRGKWPSPRESTGGRRGGPEWRSNNDGDFRRQRQAGPEHAQGDASEAAEPLPSRAPAEGADGKRHKETQAERQARREREARDGKSKKRAKPGAALANAQRGKTGIDLSGEAGTRTTFE